MQEPGKVLDAPWEFLIGSRALQTLAESRPKHCVHDRVIGPRVKFFGQ